MENLVRGFSKPGELIADLYPGTFTTVKACLGLPRHYCFVGYQDVSESFAASTEALVGK